MVNEARHTVVGVNISIIPLSFDNSNPGVVPLNQNASIESMDEWMSILMAYPVRMGIHIGTIHIECISYFNS